MESLSEEEDQFFDARDDITVVSDSSLDNFDADGTVDSFSRCLSYESWIRSPLSIDERRNKFLDYMGFSMHSEKKEDHINNPCDGIELETRRRIDCSGAVLASSCSEGRSSSLGSAAGESLDHLINRIKSLDDGTEFIIDETGQDGNLRILRTSGSNRVYTIDEFERILGLSPALQREVQREFRKTTHGSDVSRKRSGWLKKLGVAACLYNNQGEIEQAKDESQDDDHKPCMVKAYANRKPVLEFSALYAEQNIMGHDGPISIMRFSHDGLFLATAGEDGFVRVWQILECERSEDFELNDSDPLYVYYKVNDSYSEITHLHSSKDKKVKWKSSRKMMDYKFVIFPEKIFKIIEKPIHEFKGHCGVVLDLSWSKNKHILSSSMDKTVCLWQVGYDQCLKTFSHHDYVTCVQFNPMDDNNFISGSIDGKLRVWDVAHCQVIDWIDIHEMVTAVSYQPDGKGGVVGTINGNCRFYRVSDRLVSLYAQVGFHGKKKSPSSNRITGFQFSPRDPSVLMVTSADSQVRIIRDVDLIFKFRGSQSSGTQMSASFSADGKHIVSAGDGSSVYLWSHEIWETPVARKKDNHPFECFVSQNVSTSLFWPRATDDNCLFPIRLQNLPSRGSSSKCSKETLSSSSSSSKSVKFGTSRRRSQYKTSCEEVLGSYHSWGTVVVTAGSDGRIRSFQNFGLPARV